jgi:transglycosylase-like protein with SLT domain
MDVQPITVPQSLAYVFNTAGDKSNVDFDYLVKTAMRESSLNPEAKAPSSSAVGLFQFLDSTWLQVMKEEGPRLGYQKYADAITKDSSGDYLVKDKKLRTEILKLREDPQVAADMAAAFTQANGDYLKAKFGRMPSPGELYIAHFLGPQGAEKMFNAGLDNPDQVAAKLFPKQAHANPQIFYDHDGHARTIREVYKALVAKHNDLVAAPLPAPTPAPQPQFVAQQLANGESADPNDPDPSGISPAAMSFSSMYATSATPPAPAPLIGTEAAAPLLAMAATRTSPVADVSEEGPLAAINAVAGVPTALAPPPQGTSDTASTRTPLPKSLADSPLPAPAPLVAPTQSTPSSQPAADLFEPPAPEAIVADEQPVAVTPAPLPGPGTATQAVVAPLALMDPDPAQPASSAPTTPNVLELPPIPAARIEMTSGVKPNAAFFTQLAFAEQRP